MKTSVSWGVWVREETAESRCFPNTPVIKSQPCIKESTCNVGHLGLTSGLGRSPGEGKDYPLQVLWPGEFHGLSMESQRIRHD